MSYDQADTLNQGVNIICPGCGAAGIVFWENESNGGQVLAGLSKNFYERLSKKSPYPIESVCHNCGVSQPHADGCGILQP